VVTVDDPVKAGHRAVWALGDYGKISDLLVELGPALVAASGLGPGDRVLDVGAGTGNAAIPAAEAGADVVATDLTPELLAAGEREAARRGLDLRWVEADAERLPFGDGEFDVVLSSIGAMFAPDQGAAAAELLRVCRPGGTIAMANWTPGGAAGEFFRVLGRYADAPPAGPPPTAWGEPEQVHRLFGDRALVRTRLDSVGLAFTGSPAELRDYYRAHFGPVLTTYAGIAPDPARVAGLDRDLLEFAVREDNGAGAVPRYAYEYLLVLAQPR
jgi:SAM-dependent methyltransferase